MTSFMYDIIDPCDLIGFPAKWGLLRNSKNVYPPNLSYKCFKVYPVYSLCVTNVRPSQDHVYANRPCNCSNLSIYFEERIHHQQLFTKRPEALCSQQERFSENVFRKPLYKDAYRTIEIFLQHPRILSLTYTPLTENPLDRDLQERDPPGQRPPWTETPWTENPLTETPRQRFSRQRPPDRDPLDRDLPGPRPSFLGQRPPSLDRQRSTL